MRISVLIPTFNSGKTVKMTVESVLQQTMPPYEILVRDDGSCDETISLLRRYQPHLTVLQGGHQGVAGTRNELCKMARGDVVAFLDSDDIWHPTYLETQCTLSREYPNGSAFCSGHLNFSGYGKYEWGTENMTQSSRVEVIDQLTFLNRYSDSPGPFQPMSSWLVRKCDLLAIGEEPFSASGAEDAYFRYRLCLLGPVVFNPAPLVAYRITEKSLSSDRLMVYGAQVNAFELLDEFYRNQCDSKLRKAFSSAFSTARRQYGKRLMGVGRVLEARNQFTRSLLNITAASSLAKSVVLLVASYLPASYQPKWPQQYR